MTRDYKALHSATGAEEVDLSSTDFSCRTTTRRLYVGVAGTLKVDMEDGDTVTFIAHQGHHDLCVTKVYKTGTAATDIVAEY